MDANPTVITVRNNTENALCFETHAERRFGVVCHCVDQASGCAQNSPLWHGLATVAISGKNVPDGAWAPVQA
jgi:hypothetical protein